jgi:hypothetical protein
MQKLQKKNEREREKNSRACSVTNKCPCFGPTDGFAILEEVY